VLIFDNGGEFYGNEFNQFFNKCGIVCQNTTPYKPQKNGVVKRMNRMLMDKERSMLSGARITQEFRAEAIDTAKYLLNMSPSSMLFDTNPDEVWCGKNPSVLHLKVFGRDSFVHVPKKKRNKMENKEVNCIFIGYTDGMKGYKFWDLILRKIVYC